MTRKRLATGIYSDPSGIAIRISVNGVPVDFRKDKEGRPYKDRDLSWLRQERIRRQADATLRTERTAISAHSFSADVTAFLKTLSGRSREDAENLLKHWIAAFGDHPRLTLTAMDYRQHAATWTCAASTFNHRRQALISLYKALDGPNAPNPAREIPKRKETLGAPKALPYSVIDAVFAKMPPSDSRARLKLMAYTGLPQMQIQKLEPDDWQGNRLRVTPRRKGAGVAGVLLPLSKEAQQAMQELSDRKAWGNFSRSSLFKAWRRYGPPGTSPYSLRHSWITELYRRSNGDVIAVKQLALHSMLAQTERYAAAALTDRMADLVLPRRLTTNAKAKRPKGSTSVQLRGKDKGAHKKGRTSLIR